MRDAVALIVTGVIAAGLAWTFWHFGGDNAYAIFATIAIVLLSAECRRLRRAVRNLGGDPGWKPRK